MVCSVVRGDLHELLDSWRTPYRLKGAPVWSKYGQNQEDLTDTWKTCQVPELGARWGLSNDRCWSGGSGQLRAHAGNTLCPIAVVQRPKQAARLNWWRRFSVTAGMARVTLKLVSPVNSAAA